MIYHKLLSNLRLFSRGGRACVAVVKYLTELSHSTDLHLDLQNNRGDTALHLAIKFADVVNVELLLRAGADPSVKNNDIKSPVDNIPIDLKESQRRVLMSLFKKFENQNK